MTLKEILWLSSDVGSFECNCSVLLFCRGQTRVKANTCYQEYVADRHHFHMNRQSILIIIETKLLCSTKWETLTSFIQYLGKSGQVILFCFFFLRYFSYYGYLYIQCEVDLTDKGWFLKFINRDPDVLARQAVSLQNNLKLHKV